MSTAILYRPVQAPHPPLRKRAQDAADTGREVVMLWFQSVGDGARMLASKGGLILSTVTVMLAAATATADDVQQLAKQARLPAFISAMGLAAATSYKALALGRERVRKARLENDAKEAALKDANDARDRAEKAQALAETIAQREATLQIKEKEDAYNRKLERYKENRAKDTLTGQVEALTKRVDAILSVNKAQAAEVEMLRDRVSDLMGDLGEAKVAMDNADLEHRTERDMMLAEISRLTQALQATDRRVETNAARIAGSDSKT